MTKKLKIETKLEEVYENVVPITPVVPKKVIDKIDSSFNQENLRDKINEIIEFLNQ